MLDLEIAGLVLDVHARILSGLAQALKRGTRARDGAGVAALELVDRVVDGGGHRLERRLEVLAERRVGADQLAAGVESVDREQARRGGLDDGGLPAVGPRLETAVLVRFENPLVERPEGQPGI